MAEAYKDYPVTISMPVAGSYGAGDALGSRFTLSGMGIGGVLHALTVYDDGAQAKEIDVLLFREAFTGTTDNDAWAWGAVADKAKLLCVVHVGAGAIAYRTVGGDSVASVTMATEANNGLPFTFGSTPDGNLYGQIIVRATGTYTNGDLKLMFHVLR